MTDQNDIISRQAAIEALLEKGQRSRRYKIGDIWELNFDEIREVLNSLPSAEPKPCVDAVSRADVVDMLEMFPFTEYGEYETAREVVKRLPSVKSEQKTGKWIPVTERLPKQGQEVICQCRANIIKVLKLDVNGDWYEDAKHCYMGGFVVAWMPLPKPYKGAR